MYNYLIRIRREFDRSRMIGFLVGSTLLYQLSKVEFVALVSNWNFGRRRLLTLLRFRSGGMRRIAWQKVVVLDRTTDNQHVVVEWLLWKAFVNITSGWLLCAFEAIVLVVHMQRVRTDG